MLVTFRQIYPKSYLTEFTYTWNLGNLRPHSRNSISSYWKYNLTPLQSTQWWKCDPIQRHLPISLLLGSTPPRANKGPWKLKIADICDGRNHRKIWSISIFSTHPRFLWCLAIIPDRSILIFTVSIFKYKFHFFNNNKLYFHDYIEIW